MLCSGWLTIVLVVQLAPRPSAAFTVHRAYTSEPLERPPDPHASPSDVAVLHFPPTSAATDKQTTASAANHTENVDSQTRNKAEAIRHDTLSPENQSIAANSSQSQSSESLKQSIQNTTNHSHSKSAKSSRELHGNDFNIKTEAGNATSYPIQPVHDESDSVESSTAEVAVGTGSSVVPQDTTQAGAENKNETSTATAHWKKYTVIDRKRLNEDDVTTTTEKDEDLMKSAQSHISLEKAFSITSDIPSLEKLKNELLSLTSRIPAMSPDVGSSSTEPTTSSVEFTQSSNNASTDTSSETPRVEMMSSKRAGYLDYSERASNNAENTTTRKVPSSTDKAMNGTVPTNAKDKETKETPQSTGVTTVDLGKAIPTNATATTTQNKDGTKTDKSMNNTASMSNTASRSRLVDDAINEELMEEERMREQSIKGDNKKTVIEGSSESLTENSLSVKPISVEKLKTTPLYPVSPNYKPMKKIEVQPLKTFARDPDDNSWRNESLSSLGIVFKANNSTKPFTQVLRNKTETEWNSLLDKYNKNSEQELRERLERISEKRKSKRKKVDQNGDVTYVDYEESNSSGETTTKTPYQTPFIPPLHEISPPPTPKLQQSIFSLNSTAFDLEFNNTKRGNATKHNIEPFDGDSEDGDYMTLPDVDIKKFMEAGKGLFTTTPEPLWVTSPQPQPQPVATTAATFPERKATVQYFPPLQRHKVNVNEYDDNFRHKVNAYAAKEPPALAPMVPAHAKNVPTPFRPPAGSPAFGQRLPAVPGPQPQPQPDRPRHPPPPAASVYRTGTEPPPPDRDDQGFNRGAYVIKHLREFLDDVIQVQDAAGGHYTTPAAPPDYSDYETHFRKSAIDRFEKNYNAQSERFRADFPVVYNTSVVHGAGTGEGSAAASSAFLRRLYGGAAPGVGVGGRRDGVPGEPPCERTVELAPAYELHYYVPEEEEKQEPPLHQDHRPHTPRHPGPQPGQG